MAGSYGQLVVARMMVGVGEAGGVPPSYAIISDSFPRERRTTAMAIFNLGPPIGSALGVAFGASLAAAFDWRIPFYVIGAIGVVTALAVYLIVREPKRGRRTFPATPARGETGRRLPCDHRAILRQSGAADGLAGERRGQFHHLWPAQLHHALPDARKGHGPGRRRDLVRAGRRDRHERRHLCLGPDCRPVRRAHKGGLCDGPGDLAAAGAALLPRLRLGAGLAAGIAFLCVPMFLNSFFLSATVTFVQGEVPPERRVISGALLLLVMNFIGLGLGPTYVGMASDFFRPTHGAHALQAAYYALAPMYLIGAALFLVLARLIRRNERLHEGTL
jgi:MFS family permease